MTEHTRPTGKTGTERMSDRKQRDYDRLVALGIAAVSTAAVIELSTLDKLLLDNALTFAVYCFAAAIPLTTATGLAAHPDSSVDSAAFRRWAVAVLMMYGLGIVVAFAGFTALFWHFSSDVGALFLMLAIPSAFVFAYMANAVPQGNDPFEKMRNSR